MAATRTRLGALAFALAGVLFLAYPVTRPWDDEKTQAGAAAAFGSTAWVASHFFAMVGFILLPLGLWALADLVSATRSRNLLISATVVTWVGAGLVLPFYGAEDFGLHALAGPHGTPANLLALAEDVRYQSLAVSIFGLGLLLLAVGSVMMAVGVWRSGALPRWSGVLLAAGLTGFLPQFYFAAPVRIGHGVLMAIGLLVLAAAMLRPRRP